VIILAGKLPAQTWRNLDAARARRDTGLVDVRLEYTRGEVQARPTPTDSLLYDFHLRYDAGRVRPLVGFDTSSRRLTIGTRAREDVPRSSDGEAGGEAVVELGRGAPLELTARLSVASGTFDLGGLAVRRFTLMTTAGDSRIRFDSVNVATMENLEVDVTAATVQASRLANANAERIRVAARAGTVELDLGGMWMRDLEIDVDVTFGVVTIHVPADVGVELEARRLLGSVETPGLTRSGDGYMSGNFSTAQRKLRVRANATLGKIEVIHGR
jgi:hypothetical protein